MSHTDDTMRSCIGDRIQAVVEVKKLLIIDYSQCTGFELTTAVPMGCEKNKLSSNATFGLPPQTLCSSVSSSRTPISLCDLA